MFPTFIFVEIGPTPESQVPETCRIMFLIFFDSHVTVKVHRTLIDRPFIICLTLAHFLSKSTKQLRWEATRYPRYPLQPYRSLHYFLGKLQCPILRDRQGSVIVYIMYSALTPRDSVIVYNALSFNHAGQCHCT